jgi:hypothetical protein
MYCGRVTLKKCVSPPQYLSMGAQFLRMGGAQLLIEAPVPE